MSSGSWSNSDGLYIQYGTLKTALETGGDFLQLGSNRVAEVTINLASLTTSAATIVSNTLFFPGGQNMYIEKVELVPEIAMTTTGSPTLSIGLIQDDRTTVPTGGATAFAATCAASTLSTAGELVTLYVGQAGVGGFIGNYNSQWNSNALTSGATNSAGGYITATLGTTTATGQIKCRIFYHGVSTIPY